MTTASERAKERVAQELINFLLPSRHRPEEVVISVYYEESVATIRLSGERLERVVKEIKDA